MTALRPQRRKGTAREVAARFGVSPRTVQRIVAEPRGEFESRAAERQDEALALYESGLSYQGVADALGISRDTASGLVRRARGRHRNEASDRKGSASADEAA